MIKVAIIEGEGFTDIIMDGHAKDPLVCSAVSAIRDTFILGLSAIEESYTNEIAITRMEVDENEKDSNK